MKKTLFTLCLLLLCAYSGRTVAQTEATSTATITFFRTPASLLPGQFSVSETKYVRFAKGNLQYLASQNLWRFAEHQWDAIGSVSGNTVTAGRNTQSNWIDLFGWGTSGWSGGGNTNYQPWTYSNESAQYGPSLSKVPAETSWMEAADATMVNYDWGVYNFTDGPNKGYYTLSKDEWNYLLLERVNSANLHGAGKLFGVNGLFLLPDNWNWSNVSAQTTAASFVWTSTVADYSHNVISSNETGEELWEAMEAKGAVFLPCTGYRSQGNIELNGPLTSLRYWTSTAVSVSGTEYRACVLYLEGGTLRCENNARRVNGYGVRLAQAFGE